MAIIREPLDVDFFVEPIPLSNIERKAISDFIKNYKKMKLNKKTSKKTLKRLFLNLFEFVFFVGEEKPCRTVVVLQGFFTEGE